VPAVARILTLIKQSKLRWLVALAILINAGCSRTRACYRPPRGRVPLPPTPVEQFAPALPPEEPLTLAPAPPMEGPRVAGYGPAPRVSAAPPGSTGFSTDMRYPQLRESVPTTRVIPRAARAAVVPTPSMTLPSAPLARDTRVHEPPPVPMPRRAPNGAPAQPAAPKAQPTAPAEPGEVAAPGIPNYREGIEPNLASGGQPTLEGLRWLKERGFRTVVNLLPDDDADPAERGTVRELGMQYIALPVPRGPLSQDTVDRFNQLVDDAAARPLFIHDSRESPGSRAGALWYLHRVLVDQASDEVVRRQAAQIGLSDADTDLWLMIQGYLGEQKLKTEETEPDPPTSDDDSQPAESVTRLPRLRPRGR
jgi:uncharacterized protein (TIGR01244 family)